MKRLQTNNEAESYENELHHLAAEIAWVSARCHTLGARIEADQEADEVPASVPVLVEAGADGKAATDAERKVARLAAQEVGLRRQTDACLAATTESGRMLGLECLVREYDLEQVEATVLLLAAIPAVGMDLYETLGSLGSFGFAIMSVSPELVAVFGDLDLTGRVRLRGLLDENSRLVQAGLVEVGWDTSDALQDFWTATIHLTPKAYRVLVGEALEQPTDGHCPACGQSRRVVAEA